MNVPENNMIHDLKALVFLIICLLALSTGANRDSGNNSIHESELTSEIQSIPAQAIISSVTDVFTWNRPVSIAAFQNQNIENFKIMADSRLCNQQLNSLENSRDIIRSPRIFLHYLLVMPANPDDLPDLS